MMASRPIAPVAEQEGFVLLVLLSIAGAGSVVLLLAVQAFLPSLRDRQVVAQQNLEVARQGVHNAYRQDGVLPSDLDSLELTGGLSSLGQWRRDPYGAGQELDYSAASGQARLSSRGVDGALGSADDLQVTIDEEPMLRQRQRLRLRMLRAVVTRSPYRNAASMSPAEEAQMAAAMREYARARRSWLTADAATRTTLNNQMASASATISSLVSTHALPALPPTLTGAGGLMSQLAMPDTRAVDGRGVALQLDSVLGMRAVGRDGTGGTDDDM